MNIQRFKFAWARGARIESKWTGRVYNELTGFTFTPGREDDFRIHPDDEHLQYGPLSIALIDSAQHIKLTPLGIGALEVAMAMYTDPAATGEYNEWWFFYLFIAELLADEGL